ncbi:MULTISPECIES: putative leader peptide [Streptomyces]|uniref:Leader peptide n=2 Tax=Streptomyces TaxID=1883 RepID=A0ABV9IMR0_9ACTN
MRHSGYPGSSIVVTASFSGFSRRHIDLQRITSCLCNS